MQLNYLHLDVIPDGDMVESSFPFPNMAFELWAAARPDSDAPGELPAESIPEVDLLPNPDGERVRLYLPS